MNFEAATKSACRQVTRNNESSYSGLIIVIDFSILHVGGRSLFRFQITKRMQKTLGSNLRSPRPRPSIAVLEGARSNCHIVAVYNLKSEKMMWAVTINYEFGLISQHGICDHA